MKLKYTWGAIMLGLAVLLFSGITQAGRISLQALDADPRFLPTDAFHKGCEQEAQMTLSLKEKAITKVHLSFHYDPNELEISRMIAPDGTAGTYKVEYDKLSIDQNTPISKGGDLAVAHLTFKGTPTGTGATLQLSSGSYIVTNGKKVYLQEVVVVPFAQVSECDPDTIPPSIKLVYPTTTADPLTMDQYFIFDVRDSGKGVDPSSVKIVFQDKTYTMGTSTLKWKGNFLTFYPDTWLPLNAKIDLTVSVADKQVYGGANSTQKTLNFQTTGIVSFQSPMDPTTFRNMAKGAEKLFGSTEECDFLKQMYAQGDSIQQPLYTQILSKLACSSQDLSGYIQRAQDKKNAAPTKQAPTGSTLSVFAVTGWILFIIVFVLKLHYFVSYKKHKKIAEGM